MIKGSHGGLYDYGRMPGLTVTPESIELAYAGRCYENSPEADAEPRVRVSVSKVYPEAIGRMSSAAWAVG